VLGTRITPRIRNFWRECKEDLLTWFTVWAIYLIYTEVGKAAIVEFRIKKK